MSEVCVFLVRHWWTVIGPWSTQCSLSVCPSVQPSVCLSVYLSLSANQSLTCTSSSEDIPFPPPPQGIQAVIAESFERIHRSNLVGMGLLPLQFQDGDSTESLGLSGRESYSIHLPPDLRPGQLVTVTVSGEVGRSVEGGE